MRRLITAAALTAALASAANTTAQLDSIERAFDLNEVVVTGTRTAKTLKDTPVQTRLISAPELRRADATNLQDLLQVEMPGVEFSYAMNQQVNMNLAGFSGLGVLVLVDGERLAGETMDNVDFSRLAMNNVERIEIIRGAASALYGSNATGGVINIITKKPERDWTADAEVRGGSHGEWRAAGAVGLKVKRVSNLLDVSFSRMGAYDVCLDTSDECDFRRVSAHRVWNFGDRLSYSPIANLDITARAGYYFKERLYNPDIPDRYRAFSGGAGVEYRPSDVDNIRVNYSFDQYDKSDYLPIYNLDIRDYSNVLHTVKALYSRKFRKADILTAGGDFMRDRLSSYQFAQGDVHTQLTADIFVQYDRMITDRLELVGALRYDWLSDQATSCITPKLNARYTVGEVTLRGGYAGGFRAPSLKEKYMNFNMADIFDIHGNPDLRPEKSHNFNISAEYAVANYYFLLSSNYNIINNKITTSGILYDVARNPYIRYLNVDRLKVFGLDATVKGAWGCGVTASLSYNFTHEQTPGASISQYCPARPHSLNARISWNHAWRDGFDTDISLSGRYLSSVSYESMYMYDPFPTRTITNPAYTLWKLQIAQRLFEGARLTIAVDNILNYRPKVYSFNAPVTTGATLQIGLAIRLHDLLRRP